MKKHKFLFIGNGLILLILLVHTIIGFYYDSVSWPFYGVLFLNLIYYIMPLVLLNVGYGIYRIIKRWHS